MLIYAIPLESEQCSSSLNIPIIAGASGGSLLIGLVIGVIVGVVVCRRRRQQPVDEGTVSDVWLNIVMFRGKSKYANVNRFSISNVVNVHLSS